MLFLLHEPEKTLHRVLGRERVQRLSSAFAVWRTIAPACVRIRAMRQYTNAKREVLHTLLSEAPALYLHYRENPLADGLDGQWLCISADVWLIPRSVDANALFDWL